MTQHFFYRTSCSSRSYQIDYHAVPQIQLKIGCCENSGKEVRSWNAWIFRTSWYLHIPSPNFDGRI